MSTFREHYEAKGSTIENCGNVWKLTEQGPRGGTQVRYAARIEGSDTPGWNSSWCKTISHAL